MSNEDYAQTSTDGATSSGTAVVTPLKWSRQWLVTSILLGPAIGLAAAAILLYVTPKKFESKAELHYASIRADQTLTREVLEAEAQKIKDPTMIAEIEGLLLKNSQDREKSDIPNVEVQTKINGEMISITVKHSDFGFARDVANLIINRQQNRISKDNDVHLLAADEMIQKRLTEQKKLPAATQELLQLQSRLQLLERAKDRYELIVAYAAEPCHFRDELLSYQRDYLKSDALTIDSTKAEIAESPRKQDLDQRWLKLIGLMDRHRRELEKEVAQRQQNAPAITVAEPLFPDVNHAGLFAQVQGAEFNTVPTEPEVTRYLLTGSVSGLLLLPLVSLLGFVRSRNKSPQVVTSSETL